MSGIASSRRSAQRHGAGGQVGGGVGQAPEQVVVDQEGEGEHLVAGAVGLDDGDGGLLDAVEGGADEGEGAGLGGFGQEGEGLAQPMLGRGPLQLPPLGLGPHLRDPRHDGHRRGEP